MKHIRFALFLLLSFSFFHSNGQILKDESKWTFEAKKISGNLYELIIHCVLPNNLHIYALKPGEDPALIPPAFKFNPTNGVTYKGGVKERGKMINEDIPGVGMVHMFKKSVDYVQEAEITGGATIKGTYSYQICNDETCLSPTGKKPFKIVVGDGGTSIDGASGTGANGAAAKVDSPSNTPDTSAQPKVAATTPDTAKKAEVNPAATKTATPIANDKQISMVWMFLLALGGGFLAVLTPCVYSMIPITVSFFTKRSKSRQQGIKNALYYSFSIIIIYTVLGVAISAIFGNNALIALSTNWIANLVFFVIFVIFGISFLGAFEIALPSSWTSKTDSKANTESFSGIFFMALTLAIVSFSCTGPILGPLLVQAGQGGLLGPAIGMLGFSLGLAFPFALFAIFPSWLNKMAQSGGWMNQVKVVLGFVELMLAMKFLSNADLTKGWRLLDREIFIAVWIVLSVLLGLYLLGRLKLSHDDKTPENIYGQEYVSIFKLFLAIISFTFAVYLLPGMWGAPLNGVSAFVPPMGTFDKFGGGGTQPSSASSSSEKHDLGAFAPKKYVESLHIYEPPVAKDNGLVTYYDYDEALAASKQFKKPIMLDFTGINCVNCRKMESQVWSSPEVAKRLKNDFIVISLFCDCSAIALDKSEQHYSKIMGADVTTLGDKYTEIEVSKFGTNARPCYFYIDENGTSLAEKGYGYNPDIDNFVKHLDQVKENYKKLHP